MGKSPKICQYSNTLKKMIKMTKIIQKYDKVESHHDRVRWSDVVESCVSFANKTLTIIAIIVCLSFSHQLTAFVALFGKEIRWFAGKYFFTFQEQHHLTKLFFSCCT